MFHQAEGDVQWFGEKKSRVSDAVELMIHEKYLRYLSPNSLQVTVNRLQPARAGPTPKPVDCIWICLAETRVY